MNAEQYKGPEKPKEKTFILPDKNKMRAAMGMWKDPEGRELSGWTLEKLTGSISEHSGEQLTAKELAELLENWVNDLVFPKSESKRQVDQETAEKFGGLMYRGELAGLPRIIDALVQDAEFATEVKNNLSGIAKSVIETGNFPWENKGENNNEEKEN